jgi:hypothetical protein
VVEQELQVPLDQLEELVLQALLVQPVELVQLVRLVLQEELVVLVLLDLKVSLDIPVQWVHLVLQDQDWFQIILQVVSTFYIDNIYANL